MTRRKFTSKFKTKVVLEFLKERSSLSELAQKYELAPQQLSTWKREFLNGAEQVFEGKPKSK
jgi:transposase